MTTALSLEEVKNRQQKTWGSGDYGKSPGSPSRGVRIWDGLEARGVLVGGDRVCKQKKPVGINCLDRAGCWVERSSRLSLHGSHDVP